MLAAVSALVVPAYVPATGPAAPVRAVRSSRQGAVFMDETIMEKALAGELEQEGAENVFMSELGWATYLDQNAGGSYNMNQRPSMAEDGYFTADIFSNPLDGERLLVASCSLQRPGLVAARASVTGCGGLELSGAGLIRRCFQGGWWQPH